MAAGVDEATGTAEWPSPTRAWCAVAVLTAAGSLSFVDRQILTLLAEHIKRDLSLSDTGLGLLQGFAFSLFYTLLGLPFGQLADRVNRRSLIAGGIVLWSLAAASCGLARTFGQMFLARVGVGVGEAVLNPAALSLIADYFPPHKRVLPTSLFISAAALGGGLALIWGGALIGWADALGEVTLPNMLGGSSFAGWQIVFVVVGFPGVLLATVMLTIKEPARKGRVSAGDELGWGQVATFIWRYRRLFLCHTGGFAMFSIAFYGALAWTPSFFMRAFGWTPQEVGFNYGFVFLVTGLLGTIIGAALDGWLRRRGYQDAALRAAAIGATAVALPVSVAALAGDATLSLLFWGATVACFGLVAGVSASVVQQVSPAALRGRVVAIYYLVINLVGMGIGPFAVGLLSDRYFDGSLRWSILLVCITAAPVSAVMMWTGLASMRRALMDLDAT